MKNLVSLSLLLLETSNWVWTK